MKIKTKSRSAFGFDLIVGFLLLVLPTTAAIVMLFMEIWSVMRIDNNLKMLSFNIGKNLVNLKKVSNYDEDAIKALGNGLCPSATPKLVVVTFTPTTDGFITYTIKIKVPLKILGDKTLSKTTVLTSYHDVNGTVEFECQ